MSHLNEYEKWLQFSQLDADLRQELLEIQGDEDEIRSRFSQMLQFGTAGLRGKLGAGINRMNRYVVGAATQGFAQVVIRQGKEAMERGVVIAYDSRRNSDLFAKEAAMVLAGNGIRVWLFEGLRPVPELSFALRHLHAIAGIVITASHNPKEYNGYKAYWEDGSQLPPEFATKVLGEIGKVDLFNGAKRAAEDSPLITMIGREIDELFYEEVLKLSIRPQEVKGKDPVKIVFTPLHGSGNIPVREVLHRAGHEGVVVVKEQELPDPNFSTVASPNPEDAEGFTMAIALAKKEQADLILGTDPDCDRVGVAVPDAQGDYRMLTGNQIGVLLCHYILKGLREQGRLPENGCVIQSIVTTKMTRALCDSFGVSFQEVLTGFKFIGEKIKEFEETNSHTFLFGFEESYGFLSGTHARDKDGVNAAMLIAEMTAWYQHQSLTLEEALRRLYEEYGYYMERVISITFQGVDAMVDIANLMKGLRENPLKEVSRTEVVETLDYLNGVEGLPAADVLRITLSDETVLFVRPSGTEPKIKGYIMVKDASGLGAELKALKYEKAFRELLKR